MIYMAGMKMKEGSKDGHSWGNFMEGLMATGSNPVSFLPFDEDAEEQSNEVVFTWVYLSWQDPDGYLIDKVEEDWF